MLVVQWWRSFACPGSRAEGKRYHNWDGCIERITQLDSWPDVRTGSSTEMLRVSISHPQFPRKQTIPRRPGRVALCLDRLKPPSRQRSATVPAIGSRRGPGAIVGRHDDD